MFVSTQVLLSCGVVVGVIFAVDTAKPLTSGEHGENKDAFNTDWTDRTDDTDLVFGLFESELVWLVGGGTGKIGEGCDGPSGVSVALEGDFLEVGEVDGVVGSHEVVVGQDDVFGVAEDEVAPDAVVVE